MDHGARCETCVWLATVVALALAARIGDLITFVRLLRLSRGEQSIDELLDALCVLGQLDGHANRLDGRELQGRHRAGHDVALREAVHGVGDAEDVEGELLELLERIDLLRLRGIVGLGRRWRLRRPRLAVAVPVAAGARHRPAERRHLLAGAVGPIARRAAQRPGRDQATQRQADREDEHLQRAGTAPVTE